MSAKAKALNWLRRSLLGLAVTAAVCAGQAGLWQIPFVESLDAQSYDARLRLTAGAASDKVVIIDIDERALAEVGRWPWSRSTMAQMTKLLHQQGQARTIAFDVLFAEAQTEAGEDAALASAIAAAPVVLGYYLSNDRDGRANGQLPAPVFAADLVRNLGTRVHAWSGYGANLPQLQANAKGVGFFSPILDRDGVVRSLPLLGQLGNNFYESFSIAVLRHYLGNASISLRPDAVELIGQKGRLRLPVSTGMSVMVPFAGGSANGADLPFSGRFPVISAADVVSGKLDWSRIKDRIVLIGTSAPGLSDLRATPISRSTAGVEIHATLIAGALQTMQAGAPAAVVKQAAEDAWLPALLTMALAGALLSIAMPATGVFGVLALGAAGLIGLIAWHWVAFASFGSVMPLAAALLLVALLTSVNLALGYRMESRARQAVADLFGEYVSPEVVEQMTRDPSRFGSIVSENRELTIMFADVRGFTRIAESMQPEELREYINEFLTAMTQCIHRHRGTVDKYIGDAVMAFWGAPLPETDHADRAVDAAFAMLIEVGRLNKRYRERGQPELAIGIGINTGIARVGDMGSRLRRAYTVLGDAVNLASRLEALTKQFNTPIIVGDATTRRASAHTFTELAQVTVSGRTESARVFIPSMLAGSQMMPTAASAATAADAATVASANGARVLSTLPQ